MPAYPSVDQPSLAPPQSQPGNCEWPSISANSATPPAYGAPQTMPAAVGQPPATPNTAGTPSSGDQPQYEQPQLVDGAHVIPLGFVPEPQQEDEDDKSWTLCQQVTCVLAIFLPIIGFVAFCLNLNAKKGSQRQKWALCCLYTAILMILLAGSMYLGKVWVDRNFNYDHLTENPMFDPRNRSPMNTQTMFVTD
ncbi:unnamed protein product [Vitrella brassicaformis CCMP3155]|uniref:Uncharacterized protein n=1 Tax=Vitrella brassicaformis (strain CCMP3155) TaxID=1169540 RepID=A0A0G4G292_VITBC|nr:unnamed protein product [Vitrella brassicaformis CCMP3155]|eukprot:CEM21867.1 unnamed protein product [Vitrella brassicaformis CCMP3155]